MPLTIDQIVAASSKPPPPKVQKHDVSMWGRLVVGSDEFQPGGGGEQRGLRVGRIVIATVVLLAAIGAAAYFLWPRGKSAATQPATGSGSAHETIAAPGSAAIGSGAPDKAPGSAAKLATGSAAPDETAAGSGSAATEDVPAELTAKSADIVTQVGAIPKAKKPVTLKKKKPALKKRR
jgi:hypothetical protein